MSHQSQIAILGKGCIARVFAHYLRHSKPYMLLRTGEVLADTSPLCLYVNGQKQSLHYHAAQAQGLDFSSVSLFVIAIKSYHNPMFIAEYNNLLPKDLPLLLLQNGIDYRQSIARAFPENPIIIGLSSDGAYTKDDGSVHMVAEGKLDLGSLQHANQAMVDVILSAHPDARWLPDIDTAIHYKLAVNAAINPLTFVKNCKNGDILQDPRLPALVDEINAVLGFINPNYDQQIAKNRVLEVCKSTATNRSSMLQDRDKQHTSEVDSILKPLLHYAADAGIRVSTLQALFDEIKDIESRYQSSPN